MGDERPQSLIGKKRRVEGARLEPDLACVDEAFRAQGAQVEGNFLVVRDVLGVGACEHLLGELLARHRPQDLVYQGNGDGGASYTNSWRISTYAHTSPETYVYQVFTEKYGAPFDQQMRDCLESAGLVSLLEALKARFLAALARDVGLDDAETQQWIEDTQLAQLFFTVQPSKDRMQELDTYMQPHFDPSELTINLHLSALDWDGCLPSENGLRVFGTQRDEGSTVFSTPQGTCVFIWQDPATGQSCLHTANDINSGRRAVLCSFWKRKDASSRRAVHPAVAAPLLGAKSKSPTAAPQELLDGGGQVSELVRLAGASETERKRQRVMASMAVAPMPVPLRLSAACMAERQRGLEVPREGALLLQRQGFVTLSLWPLLDHAG